MYWRDSPAGSGRQGLAVTASVCGDRRCHCADPHCQCREAVVSFLHQTVPPPPGGFAAQGGWEPVGTVRVDLPSGEPSVVEPGDLSKSRLRAQWQAVRSRYRDVGALHARRYDRIKGYGRELGLADPARTTAAIATGRKVGRNEPCPCGSGKKFKRCCGASGASS